MIAKKHFRPPVISLRFWPFWRRNLLVWRKLAIPSMLGNLADPMFYLLALGFGLGSLLPSVDGMTQVIFLAGGTVCNSTMMSATFETLYSAFSRMHAQKTWESVLNAPLTLDDVVLGELLWAASKSFLSGFAILLAIWLLGLSHSPMTLWIIPLSFLIGFCFAGMGLVITALAPSYDFFLYYFTLVVTPMTLLCGVFFPVSRLPSTMQSISSVLPLTHAIELVRPMISGGMAANPIQHIIVLVAYGSIGFYIALVLTRRRLLQ